MDSSAQLAYVKSYLRRTKSLPDLKALADTIYVTATNEVVITKTSDDGGSAEGTLTFPKAVIGLAVEELIAELDPDAPAEPEAVMYHVFSTRPVSL